MYTRYPFYCPYDSFNFMRVSNHVTVESKEINSMQKYIQENIRIPVLNGIENKNIQKQINNSIQSDIMSFKDQMEEASSEYGMEAEKKGKKFVPYIISTNYTITYNKNNIISITIFYYELIDGKHFYIKTSYNFDITTGKSLSLKDLFKPGVPYREIINKEIQKQLSNNKELYLPSTSQNFKGIAEDQPFYLEDGNIVLYFGFNEIAPSISEIPIIKIPFSSFKNELKPIFLS